MNMYPKRIKLRSSSIDLQMTDILKISSSDMQARDGLQWITATNKYCPIEPIDDGCLHGKDIIEGSLSIHFEDPVLLYTYFQKGAGSSSFCSQSSGKYCK